MKTIITFPVKLGLLCSLLFLLAFIPRGDDPVDKLVTILQKWTDSIPQEKVYLQMDKPYYALGDTIWFKGYITIGSRHQLSALSGSLYVDLITDKDSVARSLKLPITSGMVMGDFILGDDFKEGSYRIRAYTQWMRNAGEDYFFDHTFTVGDLVSHNIITKADYQYKDIDQKPVLTAMLNYSTDDGAPLAGRDVHYQIIVNKKVVWSKSVKTDAQGNIPVSILNDKHVDLRGSYIHTTLDGPDKYTIVRDFPIKAGLAQTDVQFFPESGNLVNGILSRVAFKAVGVDGSGIAIKGKITDNENNEVGTIETLHAGMGSFLLRPVSGKTYTAKISFADGTVKTVALPVAVNEGYVLGVYQPNKDSLLARIYASKTAQNTSVNLIAHTNGETIFASPVKIAGAVTSIWLEKKLFPTGIAQFTIFNNTGEPLNERIAFVRGNDQMQLDLKTAKNTYNSKEHVQVSMAATNSNGKPTFGNFSVTVIDESKVPVDESDESTIFSNLLLTSDLKGYVEKPNYYFTRETAEVNKALDNLMLTQGYRRFTWKELNNTVNTRPLFAAEGLGVAITGKVTTLGNKILPNAKVTLVSVSAGVMKGTTTDANGRFKFDGIFMTDSIKFAVQARSAKNSDKVMIVLDTLPKLRLNKNPNLGDVSTNITGTLKTYIESVKKEDDIYEKSGQLDKVHRLREVRIRARKPEPPPYKQQGMYRIPEGHADQTYVIEHPENCAALGICLQGMLRHVVFEMVNGQWVPKGCLVILDGRVLKDWEIGDLFTNNSPEPEAIAKIDVVFASNPLAMTFSGPGAPKGGPAILIYTKKDYIRKSYNPSMANVSPKGFNRVREFYSPRYDRPGSAAKLPDLRTTVYWNPYLKTDISGKTTFNFFNADGPGTYKVIVEGINADGELGRQVYRYTVDADQAKASSYTPPPADKSMALITAPLDSFNRKLPIEKVYLHTDKPYYNIGDTLWFKSYVVDHNNQPSKISGLLYVELANDTSEAVKRISITVKDGVGSGQIPLTKTIFREGGYTLRAYTNWMQNFGQDYIFNQRFYLGQTTADSWLVKSSAGIDQVAGKDQLQVELKLNKADKSGSPVALKKLQVKIYDEWHYLFKEELQTDIDGSLKFGTALKDKMDGRRIRAEIISLEKGDNHKMLQIPLKINRGQNIDLQFLPEGGKLVAGLKSVIGFKAIAENGSSTAVTGAVYDSKGNEVVSFATMHNGMGSFEFTPGAGEVYTARTSQPAVKNFEFPKISPSGTVIHINNSEQGDDLKITLAGISSLGTDSACYLVGTARGIAYYSEKITDQTSLTISKNLFPSGIARFTLFKGLRPLNERAVFIDHRDGLNIKVTPNKMVYVSRDSVGLEIEVKDKSGIPVQGNFSLAVTDDSQVKPDSADNNGITASLLINSELTGHIESPGYYINRKDKQAWQALDNLMLTQGWTGYDWGDIFINQKEVKFKPEKELVITGKVTNALNKPVTDARVLISSQKPAFFAMASVDDKGSYVFKNLPQTDSGSFFLQANNARGKKITFGTITVDRFSALPIPSNYKDPILPWYVNTDSAQINYMKRAIEKTNDANLKLSGRVLKEVKINGKKIIRGTMNPFGPGQADEIYDEQDIKESATTNLYELLQQKLPGFKVLGARLTTFRGMDLTVPIVAFNGKNIRLNIDGGPVNVDVDVPTSGRDVTSEKVMVLSTLPGRKRDEPSPYNDAVIAELRNIKLQGLIGLEISYSRKYIDRICHSCDDLAIVQITTGQGMGWYRRKPVGVVSYRPLPVLYPQQFYSPKYNVAPSSVIEPDYRSTLYWEPNINTDQNGKAKVYFYTSDIKSKYTIKIAGIDANGGIGDGSLKINQPGNEIK
ncbi:carboxypeptidase-like regulatory domain-containing protein [Mucilaginibacter sp. UR6-11]|uniref:carboxypeptidase-like regulatory domain-containing protein n=1 Tax=Mucilaginibacter sp. UR6-11 TaxID=1435644 RepID=UPI001E3A7C63|nr:carboxypeptidase-like regulatory domain-containing protein [Mucilaginibacter sp. UR6-11]MCC8426430.1 hypothetical protein [Mucilaginibacter sp. UR6-11]